MVLTLESFPCIYIYIYIHPFFSLSPIILLGGKIHGRSGETGKDSPFPDGMEHKGATIIEDATEIYAF